MKINLQEKTVRDWLLLTIALALVISFLCGVMVGKADGERMCFNEIRIRDMMLGKLNTNELTYVVDDFVKGTYKMYYNDSAKAVKLPESLLSN